MHINDLDILQAFKQPNTKNKAFELLLEKYTQRVYWHVRRIVINHEDADDVVQNVFIKVWQKLDGFKAESALFTWLYRIATNEALQFLQKKKQQLWVNLDDVYSNLENELKADMWFNGSKTQLLLQEAILTLPEKQRLVFNMRYFDELSYEEMSEILNTSQGALKASYYHAVKKIESILKQSLNVLY
jgi:RNA polymerase sigma-70 factor (ECF subfamily)